MEEARGRQRALLWLTRLLGRGPLGPVAPLLSSERSSARRFPANVIYEDEEVAAALLCARFLFPFPRPLRPPVLAGTLSRGPVARCPGARQGGWRRCCGWVEGRGTDGASLGCGALYCTIPKTSRFFGAPLPRLPRRVLGCWCCPARLGSQPRCVVCALACVRRGGPLTVTHLVAAADVCRAISLWRCKSCKVCCRGMGVVLPRVG